MVLLSYCADDYRYGYQGQETDDEVKGEGNSVNYKYRMHDPRIGRFFAVDPLTAEYPHYTPYSFSGNRVMDAVELEGLEPSSIHLILTNNDGVVIYDTYIEAPNSEHLGDYYLESVMPYLGLKSGDFELNSHLEIQFNVDEQQVTGVASIATTYLFQSKKPDIVEEKSWNEVGGDGPLLGAYRAVTGDDEGADEFREWDSSLEGGQPPTIVKIINGLNPIVSVMNGIKVLATEKDIYGVESATKADKGLAAASIVLPFLPAAGAVGTAVNQTNTVVQGANDAGLLDGVKQEIEEDVENISKKIGG